MDIEDGEPPEEPEEGSYPRTDSTYSIDIPNSAILWEADPRPENSPQVRAVLLLSGTKIYSQKYHRPQIRHISDVARSL